jgi:phosphate-selective porin OprO/OprP
MHRIEALHQREIHALQAQIKHLRKEHAVRYTGPVVKGPGVEPALPFVTMTPGHQFGLSSADGLNSIYFNGVVQLDAAGKVGGSSIPQNPANAYFRRARIGVGGKFYGDWNYFIRYDFGGSKGVDGTGSLENAYIQYNGFYNHYQPFPVSLTIGAIDVPWTMDEMTGAYNILFMERSAAQQLAVHVVGAGDSRISIGATSNNNRYFAGAWVTGPTTGSARDFVDNEGSLPVSGLVRGAYQIIQTPNASLHLGANYGIQFTNGNTGKLALSSGNTPEVNAFGTMSYLDGTGWTSLNPAVKNSQVIGAEAAATYGNAWIQGEYYHYIIDTAQSAFGAPGGTANFDGGYAQASYTFGGHRHYNAKVGAYSGVIPDHPFEIGTGGWGALEFGARYSIIDASDSGFSALTGGLDPTKSGWRHQSVGGVASWYPNLNLRFELEYQHVNDNQINLLTGAYNKSGSFDYIAARSQVVW